MSTKYGYSEEQWCQAKQQLKELLIRTARRHSVISIKEAAGRITAFKAKPHTQVMDVLLREVCLEEEASGRGILLVLITEKEKDQQPVTEFFELARELGREADYFKCWRAELQKVYSSCEEK